MPKKIRVWYRRERKRWYGEYWLNYKRFAKAFKRKAVSYLAAQGESAAVLQKHTGHKSFKTTAGYIGVSTDTQERVTMKLDQLFVKIL